MTRRAALLLEALADGPLTRAQIFERTGFLMSNNAASELRAAGYLVRCERKQRTYTYRLLGERSDYEPVPLVEQPDGQYALDVAA